VDAASKYDTDGIDIYFLNECRTKMGWLARRIQGAGMHNGLHYYNTRVRLYFFRANNDVLT
jgi:hypothetical protein